MGEAAMHRFRRVAVSILCGVLACGLCAADLGPGQATLVSYGNMGVQGDDGSYEGSPSNNGMIVAWYSSATNLVPSDGNAVDDVFVRDLRTGDTEIISVDENGDEGDSGSYYPQVSANGRWVVFYTDATNVAPDAAGSSQVVAYDRRNGTMVQVSASPFSEPANGGCDIYDCRPMTANGRWVVFYSSSSNLVDDDTNDANDVFIHDIAKGTTTRIMGIDGEVDGDCYYPSITPNGRWIIFSSNATNLVEDDDNNQRDVFLHDRKTGRTTLVSIAHDGAQGTGVSGNYASAVSNNGKLVAFPAGSTNLVPSDGNGVVDMFLRDLRAGTTTRISVGPTGTEGDGFSGSAGITPNGRLVSYWTYAGNIIDPTDTIPYDQIVYDTKTGVSVRGLQALGGGEPGGGTYGYWAGISANGRWFVITCDGDDVDPDDDNGQWDVFRVDLK
jgi:Tol biopolymer transport system component